ncbi:hypothetical protein [Pseudoxanthomonas wuyuanensis]|uniref:Lipoprotein n=1 Tax=Pseudoxanthomonas wuyuanensis TaxID=1073196 RepID=A0A286DBQ5_9GAMM|nr:hypothetical protein [Pseudoxanthomonas wuyuanensis]SOD56090.1 hypothetical protein SAMN06296416_108170 [Pseudoxanthomonas wuyuanensis]
MSPRFAATLAFGVLVLLLGACDSRSPTSEASRSASGVQDNAAPEPMDHPPSEQEIRNAARARNCELVAVQNVKWPDDSYRIPASHSDAQVIYVADCKADGGNQVHRITFEAQFAAVSSGTKGNSARVWELRLNQPAEQSEVIAHPARAVAPATFSDGPECNALMEQVQRQVVPCVEKIDPSAARRVQSWVDVMGQRVRRSGGSGDRAFEEMKIDEDCLQSWHTTVASDFRGSSPFKMCAPR